MVKKILLSCLFCIPTSLGFCETELYSFPRIQEIEPIAKVKKEVPKTPFLEAFVQTFDTDPETVFLALAPGTSVKYSSPDWRSLHKKQNFLLKTL